MRIFSCFARPADRQLKQLSRQLNTIRTGLRPLIEPVRNGPFVFASATCQKSLADRLEQCLYRAEHAAQLRDALMLRAALLQVRNELSMISLLARHRATLGAPATRSPHQRQTSALRRHLIYVGRYARALRETIPIQSGHRVRIARAAPESTRL